MNIGLDARLLGRPDYASSGIGSYVCGLIQALARVDHENRYYLFESTAHSALVHSMELPGNFAPVPTPRFCADQLQDQIGLVWAMQKLGLHVFHTTAHFLTPLLSRVPLVVTVHDMAVIDFPSSSWAHRAYFGLFSRLALYQARHLLCDSFSTGRIIERYSASCMGRWTTVYPGCDPYFRVHFDSDTLLDLDCRFGIRPPYILYVGSFEGRKNLTNMVRAFDVVKRARPDVQFVVVGKPGSRYDVVPDVCRPGMIVSGRVARRELRALYNRAELLLFTTFYEGFGIPVLEAMACGCPVVTSPVTSLPEVGGEAVLYAAPDRPEEIANQALRLLSEPELRKAMIDKGLEQASRFNWDKAALLALEIYRKYARSGGQG